MVRNRHWHRHALACALASTMMFAACTRDPALPESGGTSRSQELPAFSMASAPSGLGAVTPVMSDSDVVGQISTAYPYPTLVTLTGHGFMTMYYGSSEGWGDNRGKVFPDGDFPSDGRYDGASINNCSANIGYIFLYNGNETANHRFCRFGDYVTPYSAVDTAVVRGTGTIKWYKGYNAGSQPFCGGPGKAACFTFTGAGYAIVVAPFPADMSLSSDLEAILTTGPQYTTFRVQVTPGIVAARSEVTIVQSWVWAADSGASQSIPANCIGQKTCEFFPTSSGTMTVLAIVNGVLHQSSKHIDVGCPPSGDALLDQRKVRDAMRQLLADSRPELALDTARREKVMYIWQDGDSLIFERGTEPEVFPPNCRSAINPIPTGNRKLLGVVHSHPYNPGTPGGSKPDKVFCGYLENGNPNIGGYVTGPSDSDFVVVDRFNLNRTPKVPFYIIDVRYISRIDAGKTDPKEKRKYRWRHVPSECVNKLF